jgi:shikimate kinase
MKIVITGFMGSGKTRIACELARRLDLSVVDLDEWITVKTGRSPAQLISDEGEEAFRLIESATLHELLRSKAAQIIALGGGAWIQKTNRDLIEEYNYLSVWLDTPFEVCWARIETSGEDRPLGKTRQQAEALYDSRRPIYQLARIHIPVADEDNLDALLAHLEANLG